MTLLACQIFSTIAQEGSFARTAERLHLTPSAISHAVAGWKTSADSRCSHAPRPALP